MMEDNNQQAVTKLPTNKEIQDYWKRKNCFGGYLEGLIHGSEWVRDTASSLCKEKDEEAQKWKSLYEEFVESRNNAVTGVLRANDTIQELKKDIENMRSLRNSELTELSKLREENKRLQQDCSDLQNRHIFNKEKADKLAEALDENNDTLIIVKMKVDLFEEELINKRMDNNRAVLNVYNQSK